MRRSKTLAQQAKYYEVENETAMMDLMIESWINGNFSTFKDYYLMLDKKSRKQFINYLWCNTESREFYKMIDFLFFGKPIRRQRIEERTEVQVLHRHQLITIKRKETT